MAIQTRQLGKNGPQVPAMGLGLLGISGAYGKVPDDEERFKMLDRAVEIGATFWDTANIYGDSEELIGKWFARTGKRDQIFLATKFGILMDKMQHKGEDSSPEYAEKSLESSLKKLQTDYIDLFYVHRINPDTPIEATMRAMAKFQAEGKIKHIALSEASSDTLRRASKIATVAAVQQEYSFFAREIEKDEGTYALQTARELGITTVCYSPLGRGLLTANYLTPESLKNEGDMRSAVFPWWQGENFTKNIEIIKKLRAIAESKGCTTSQLGLAWLLKQGEHIIPSPGTKKIKYLEENVAALDITLTDQDEKEIRLFLEANEPAGYRSIPNTKQTAFVTTRKEG